MVTSMIPNVNNVFKNPNIIDMRFLSPYNPLINYDWSTTTTSGLRYLKDVGSTPTYNASMYFGRGAYLNGVDQTIPFILNMSSINTIAVRLKREPNKNFRLFGQVSIYIAYVNFDITSTRIRFATGVEFDFPYTVTAMAMVDVVITKEADTWCLYENGVLKSTKVFTGTSNAKIDRIGLAGSDYSQGTIEDLFVFSRGLTQSEKDSYTNTPELFYAMAQADNTCVLNMPMCEISSTVRNYKTGIDYPITNYTTSVRDNAKNLQYGLQTCKFVRDSLGVIQSPSNYLECDGTGYATIPSHTDKVNIKMTVNPTSLSGNLLSGGVTKTLTGLTLNVDNDVVISNVTPTGAITLASGFTGTIKSYKEELV